MHLNLKEALELLEQGSAVNFDHFSLEDLLEVARDDFYYLAEEIQQIAEARMGVPPRLAQWADFWHNEISAREMIERLHPETLSLKVLGYKGPKTVRLLKTAPEDRIMWARHLELNNEDLIQRVLEKPSVPFRWWICQLLVKAFSKPVRIRLIQTAVEEEEILDEIEMLITENNVNYEEVEGRIRNWKDLLTTLKWIVDTRETRLPINARFRPIDGAQVGTFTIKIPRTVNELIDAGKTLRNCLGTYAQTIRRGSVILFLMQNNATLAYALEVYRGSVQQFLGPQNSEAPLDVKQPVLKFLLEKGLINN